MNSAISVFKKSVLFLLCTTMLFSFIGCKKQDASSDYSSPDEILTETTQTVSVADKTLPVSDAKYNIGVIVSEESDNNLKALEGFENAFDARVEENIEAHHNLIVILCDDEDNTPENAAEKFVDSKVDLIFAIGEDAATAAAEATDSIPVIFCSVFDPIEADLLDSTASPDKNVTGVSDFTPAKQQMELIRELFPDTKKVSALYCSTDADSILVSTLAQNHAEALRFDYTSYGAADDKQFVNAVRDALDDTDILYLCEDDMTLKNAEAIFKAAKEKKVPVISASETFMSKGAIATALPDYTELGYCAGELALICLKDLSPISDIAVEYPDICINFVSKSAAEAISVDTSHFYSVEFVD